MNAADRELKVALTKLSDVSFELDELSMPARVRQRLAQLIRHAEEAAHRAVRFAREEGHAK
jgi:hypothetical protein